METFIHRYQIAFAILLSGIIIGSIIFITRNGSLVQKDNHLTQYSSITKQISVPTTTTTIKKIVIKNNQEVDNTQLKSNQEYALSMKIKCNELGEKAHLHDKNDYLYSQNFAYNQKLNTCLYDWSLLTVNGNSSTIMMRVEDLFTMKIFMWYYGPVDGAGKGFYDVLGTYTDIYTIRDFESKKDYLMNN